MHITQTIILKMRQAVIYLTVLTSIAGILLCSCNILKPKQLASTDITFGKGGGFTGKYDEYRLSNNGNIFKKNFSNNEFTLLKKLPKKETKNIFKEIETNKLFDIKFAHPYNISCFIEISKDTLKNKIVWGDTKNPPPPQVIIVFDKLMDLVKSK
jgi:hypothetical protein